MNLIRHLLIVLVLDAGAVMAFGGDEHAQPAALPLCSSPSGAALSTATEPGSTSTSTTTEHVHENQ